MEKWPFLDQNHKLTLWKNVNFSTVWISGFCSLETRFLVLEYHKRHFPGLYCPNKKVRKTAIFGPKPWVNPCGKMRIFRFFLTSCFYSLERRFSVLEYQKSHFPCLYCLKKKVGKMAFFGPKPCGLTPFEKFQFFDFVLKYYKRHFRILYCLLQKVGKMAIFGQQPWVNPF